MMADITDILDAQRAADQPGETFRALDAALANKPGHILFTILIHHPALRQNERFYSNMPEAYPVGGRKPVTDSAWMEQVIGAGQPYIGHTRDDIRDVFFDYELIWSLGCESVLNMPVRFGAQTFGTINLLHTAHHYSEAHLYHVRLLAQLALPAMMLISRT
jgi:transcriptional regulator with GAF, ATPase, and Fis domain